MDFNTAAAGWDTERRIKRARIIADEIAASINIKDAHNALEFGCGTGLVSLYLSDRFRHITLVDSSEGMIKELERKLGDAGISNISAVFTDICSGSKNISTSFQEEIYDVIYSSMAMHHVKDIKALLNTFSSLLRPGGHLCIVDLNKDDGSFHRLEEGFDGHNGFDQDELGSMLEDSGFASVSSRTFYRDKKMIGDVEVPYSLFIMTGAK